MRMHLATAVIFQVKTDFEEEYSLDEKATPPEQRFKLQETYWGQSRLTSWSTLSRTCSSAHGQSQTSCLPAT